MAYFIFPKHLDNAGYENRAIYIEILKNTANFESPEKLLEYITKKSSELTDIVKKDEKVENTTLGYIDAFNKKAEQFAKIFDKDVESIHWLALPLPNNLENNHDHNWSTETGVAKNILGDLIKTADKSALNIAADALSVRKPLIDPGYFQTYSGTSVRKFSMSFDLIPNSAEEAGDIIKILTILKSCSLPSMAINSTLLLAPHFFNIHFNNKYIDGLMAIKGVVLESIRTNYSGDGLMQQTIDGMPKHIKLDLTFAERKMSLADYYPVGE